MIFDGSVVFQVWFQNKRSKERRLKQLTSMGRGPFFGSSRKMRGFPMNLSPGGLDEPPPGFPYFATSDGKFEFGYGGPGGFPHEFFPGHHPHGQPLPFAPQGKMQPSLHFLSSIGPTKTFVRTVWNRETWWASFLSLKNTTDNKVLEEESLYRSFVQRPLLSELLTVISVAIFVSSLFSYLKNNGKHVSLPRGLRVAYYYLYGTRVYLVRLTVMKAFTTLMTVKTAVLLIMLY